MSLPYFVRCGTAALLLSVASLSLADTFGSGDLAFEIPFVPIGDPGNPADTTGAPNPAGAVGYYYRIGMFEVPEIAIRNANALSEAAGEPLGITIDERGPQQPATRVSWLEAARFVNWLNEDKGAPPAYKFDDSGEFALWEPGDSGFNPDNRFRNSRARYFIPSIDEWYKAAYYDPVAGVYWDFPTGSDDAPNSTAGGNEPGTAVWNQAGGPANVELAGGISPQNTIGQGGNVLEWQESADGAGLNAILTPDIRVTRGGTWSLAESPGGLSSAALLTNDATLSFGQIGFRVARVPEPMGSALVVHATLAWLLSTRRSSALPLL